MGPIIIILLSLATLHFCRASQRSRLCKACVVVGVLGLWVALVFIAAALVPMEVDAP